MPQNEAKCIDGEVRQPWQTAVTFLVKQDQCAFLAGASSKADVAVHKRAENAGLSPTNS